MDEAPNVNFRKDKADKLRPVLKTLIESFDVKNAGAEIT